VIRAWVPGDRAFVADSWLSSFRASHWAGPIPRVQYRDVYGKVVDELLDRPGVSVAISCNPEDPNQILGWACYQAPKKGEHLQALHYVYVKAPFRDHKHGTEQPRVAVHLLKHLQMDGGQEFAFVFRTPQWDKFRARWRLNAKYLPELVNTEAR
jgi:hypothetical protein